MLNYALRVNLTIAVVEMIYDENDNHTVANLTLGPHNVTEVRILFSYVSRGLYLVVDCNGLG